MLLFLTVLEFVSKSNIPASAGLDVCPLRQPKYIISPYIGIMSRMPTALHLPIAQIDDTTRPIVICNDTHKFVTYTYSTLQEFTVDNKVMVTSHPEDMRRSCTLDV